MSVASAEVVVGCSEAAEVTILGRICHRNTWQDFGNFVHSRGCSCSLNCSCDVTFTLSGAAIAGVAHTPSRHKELITPCCRLGILITLINNQ